MNDDGVSLQSMAHPVPPWWKRVLMFWRRPRIARDSIERVDLEIKSPYEDASVLNSVSNSPSSQNPYRMNP